MINPDPKTAIRRIVDSSMDIVECLHRKSGFRANGRIR
jgi:hypothetical protein